MSLAINYVSHRELPIIITAHTGEDEDTESDEDRRRRMSRESLYDDTLAQFEQYEEYKDAQAAKTKKKQEEEAALVIAGRPSTAAALGRMAVQMVAEQENTDVEEDDDETRARKRRRFRQENKSNRKAMTMSLALQPICDCLTGSVKMNAQLAREEAKRFEKQTLFENKMNAIFAAAAAKTANLPIDVKNILNLVDLTT